MIRSPFNALCRLLLIVSDWGDENPVRLTMEGDPVFVPFQKAVLGALVA